MIHVVADPWKTGEIAIDNSPRFVGRDAKPRCQSVGRDAVYDAKIYSFCLPALIGIHHFERNIENRSGGSGMNILSPGKSLFQRRIAGKMRHHPQFYLRIIGAQNHIICLLGNKCSSYLTTHFSTNGNILQVGIAAGQTPGSGNCLIEGGVQPPGSLADQQRQCIHVGRFQLDQLAVFQNFSHNRVTGIFFQYRFGSRKLAGGSSPRAPVSKLLVNLKLLKKYLAQLLRRIDIEFASCKVVNLFLQFHRIRSQVTRHFLQEFDIDLYAVFLHFHKNAGQRHLNFFKKCVGSGFSQFLFQKFL